MQNAIEYLDATESASRHLFTAVNSYMEKLKKGVALTFTTSKTYGPEQDAEYQAWCVKNAEALEKASAARAEFRAEYFALNTICGAILQIAEKGIEIYSKNTTISPQWEGKISPALAKFCVGRIVRETPLGLIIYAGRNQHTHFNDKKLRNPSARIIQEIATKHGYNSTAIDPAFNLDNSKHISLAANITSLIDWRSFDTYRKDMQELLSN